MRSHSCPHLLEAVANQTRRDLRMLLTVVSPQNRGAAKREAPMACTVPTATTAGPTKWLVPTGSTRALQSITIRCMNIREDPMKPFVGLVVGPAMAIFAKPELQAVAVPAKQTTGCDRGGQAQPAQPADCTILYLWLHFTLSSWTRQDATLKQSPLPSTPIHVHRQPLGSLGLNTQPERCLCNCGTRMSISLWPGHCRFLDKCMGLPKDTLLPPSYFCKRYVLLVCLDCLWKAMYYEFCTFDPTLPFPETNLVS